MNKEIIPAIITSSQKELDEAINKVKPFAKRIQIDVMDGKFVENKSFQFDFELPKVTATIEAHLMVEKPKAWIKKHADKVDVILFHAECLEERIDVINAAKEKNKKVGMVINPPTKVGVIAPYLDKLDEVLVMTVYPGAYGAEFLPETLDKVKELRKLKPDLNIEVDGGITEKTIQQALEAGANLFVSGSFIMKSEQPEQSFEELKKLIE